MQVKQIKKVTDRGRTDPAWWVNKVLGDIPWQKQIEILESVRDQSETSVKSCHGAGKSFIAARTALWFLYNFYPSLVLTTAPTDRQVKGILWKEIRTAHAKSKYPLGGEVLIQELKLDTNWFAMGFTAPEYDPDRFQGYHEANILVIVDEAAGVGAPISEAIDGILSTGFARRLNIGNPTDSSGPFGQSFKFSDVSRISISAFDTPNFTAFGITEADIESGAWKEKVGDPLPYPSLVSPEWVATRLKRWGKDSPMYMSRVRAIFPGAGPNALIPLIWVEAAQGRQDIAAEGPLVIGVDVARFGDDSTAIAPRRGKVVPWVTEYRKEDTMETVGRVILEAKRAEKHFNVPVYSIGVDVIGVGSGVADRLREVVREEGYPWLVVDVNVAESVKGEYLDKGDPAPDSHRDELWWEVREWLKEGASLPADDDILAGELTSPIFKVTSKGKIKIESKDDMKKRGLPSPNKADAVCITFSQERGPGLGLLEHFRKQKEAIEATEEEAA